MTDSTIQRLNMVECQIRPSDVTDLRILRAMGKVAREDFLPSSHKSLAYVDIDQPLLFSGQERSPRRFLLAPRTLAKLLQLGRIEPTHRVLDVGCGTGYAAAVVSPLCQRVIALECDPILAEVASQTLTSKGLKNVTVVQRSLGTGYPEEAGFDTILLEGCVCDVPQCLLDQIKEGGRLVAILKSGYGGRAYVWLRSGQVVSSYADFDIPEARYLPGFEAPEKFVF